MPAQNIPGLMLDRAHPLSRGLVGWWPINEGAGERVNDISGNGEHGKAINVVQSATAGWTGGPLGRAFRFDGSDDYIECNTPLKTSLAGPMSISLWVNPPDRSGYYMLATKTTASPANPFQMHLRLTSGYVFFGRGTDAGANDETSNTTAPPLNQWSHIVVTSTNAGGNWSNRFYQNGSLNSTQTGGTAIADDTTSVLRFGRRGDGNYSKCATANIRIYNRVLSASEVAQLYADPLAGALAPVSAARYFVPATISPPAAPPTADRLWNRGYVGRIFRRGEKG